MVSSAPGAGAPPAKPKPPATIPRVQGGAPAAAVPRPMSCGNLGAAGAMAAPSPTTPHVQAAAAARMAPDMPMNCRTVGPAVPTANPHMPLPPMRQPPAAANPPAPFPSKRKLVAVAPAAMGPAAIPPAKRHAPSPRTAGAATATMAAVPARAPNVTAVKPAQGVPTGRMPLPTNSTALAVAAKHAPMPPPRAQGAGAPTGGAPGGAATPSRAPPPQVPTPLTQPICYLGVHHDPNKGWMAYVFDPKRSVARDIGPFKDEHLAAVAHDRVAVAAGVHGDGANLNFKVAFHRIEHAFLHRCAAMEAIDRDLCGVIEQGTYEDKYAEFLTNVFRSLVDRDHQGDDQTKGYDEFWDVILEFFIVRANEIGEENLVAGGEKLETRFIEMHRSKASDPAWRRWYLGQLQGQQMMVIQKQQIQQQRQQQQQRMMMMVQQQFLDGNDDTLHVKQEV